MKVFIIGVGLIGGSLAKDLKSIGDFQLTGIDKNKLNFQMKVYMLSLLNHNQDHN